MRRSTIGVDVALYNIAGLPINHWQQACPILLGSAHNASRPVKVGGRTVTPYGGVNRLTPLGRVPDPTFTPPSAVYNGIVGISLPLRKVTFFLECKPGGIQLIGGMGALYVLPQYAPTTVGAPPAGASSEKRNSL